MKKNKGIKSILILLTCLLIVVSNNNALAKCEYNESEPYYVKDAKVITDFKIVGSQAQIYAKAIGKTSTESITITIILQKKVANTWLNIRMYLNRGGRIVELFREYDLKEPGQYRIKVEVVLDGIETITKYSYASY